MRVDVQTVRHAKVKIDLRGMAGGNRYLRGIKELNCRICGQGQRLILHHLHPRCKSRKEQHGDAEHLLFPCGQRLFNAGLYFVFGNQARRFRYNLSVPAYKVGGGKKLDPAVLARHGVVPDQ
jgi:hypothetical protein